MERDCKTFVHKCVKCQEHGNNLKLLLVELHNLVAPWLFAQWGIDTIRPLPISQSQKKFLLVVIDYFTKRVDDHMSLWLATNNYYG
ncbi:hypothetical protein VIGAN_01185300 [Vigna angularis var. angularis]|uniref:Integrase zinc-binding domain-containing protein n=1 Tax=Vigna angularis var. angularis TaxID=157739 RepID=A0A0S3R121_PHAAN|nr:hypothetical protein VIGAN_01185300 [Vigna angularis var. angularis]